MNKFCQLLIETHHRLIEQSSDIERDHFELEVSDVEIMFNSAKSANYEKLLVEERYIEVFLKSMIHTIDDYGKMQFEAGVEAARKSIVEDHSIPPQFVP